MVSGRRFQWSTINWRYTAASLPAAAAWLGQSSSHRSSLPEGTRYTFRALHVFVLRGDAGMRCTVTLQSPFG